MISNCITYYKIGVGLMATIRCGYCGRYYDDGYMSALDNGSPACPECVEDEEAEKERKRKEQVQEDAQETVK